MLVWSSSRSSRPRSGWRTLAFGLTATVLALVLVVLSAEPAAAGAKWCEDDPLISVNGRIAHVTVGFSSDDISKLSGKITYHVVVAQSYLATTIVDASMATLPTDVFVYPVPDDTLKQWWGEKYQVAVYAHVPARKNFITVTTVTDFSQTVIRQERGRSNTWVEVKFALK
jgi:hypothetical protein